MRGIQGIDKAASCFAAFNFNERVKSWMATHRGCAMSKVR